MAYRRDPVSVLFDAGARRLLDRAYAKPGTWVGTRLADPGPRHAAYLVALGINPAGPDDASVEGGQGLNAKSRWARGFVRAIYYQHKWWSSGGGPGWRESKRSVARHAGALQIEVGRRVPVLGVIPAGRAVRIRIRAGGQAATKAVKKLPDQRRIYDDRGRRAARASVPELRDWA